MCFWDFQTNCGELSLGRLRIRNGKDLRWKTPPVNSEMVQKMMAFLLSLAFFRRNAAVWCTYYQRSLSHASCQHNNIVNAPGLCHEISGRKVVSVTGWRQFFPGAAHWLLKATLVSNPHSWFIARASLQKKSQTYPEPSYLPAYLHIHTHTHTHKHTHTHTHTHIHTHFCSLAWARNTTVLIRKNRLTWAKDWNGKKYIFEYCTIPQIPLPPKAVILFPGLLPFMCQVFAFFDSLGLLLAGLNITKISFHLMLQRRKLKNH